MIIVGPAMYRAYIETAFKRDPFERARLLFNAGYRGKDLH